ncbi:MAG: hypothetical protein JKX67_03970 [Colwellia sp.]|nr:hypothetical protein [Colwellia sp.]
MSGAVENPILGLSVFVIIKLAGYMMMARYINSQVDNCDNQTITKVALTRTFIGMLVGGLYWLVLLVMFKVPLEIIIISYFSILLLLRYFEWYFLLWLFYKPLLEKTQHRGIMFKGIFLSYILDLPAAYGVIFTAGIWVG